MTLANGRHILAIPGPSIIPDEVLRAIHRPTPNIYTGAIYDVVRSIVDDLKVVARTRHHVAMYIANGHGAWEAAVVNALSRADKVLVLVNGSFALGWAEVCAPLGIEVELMDFGRREPLDMSRVEERLRADHTHEIKAVMAVHVDTSSSIRNDIAAVRATLDATDHPALLMADCVASLACDPFEMDAWGVDVMVAGSQKGLMTPPGMAFVFFNDRADAARERSDLTTRYWDWRPRVWTESNYQYFGGTLPVPLLYGLRTALDMLLAEGMDAVFARHKTLANAIWAACDAWGVGGTLALNMAQKEYRSHAVTTVRIEPPHGTALRKWMETNAGVTLGISIGLAASDDPARHGIFRIGHMGHINTATILGVLAAMDTGLKALGIPHGDGALERATEICANHTT